MDRRVLCPARSVWFGGFALALALAGCTQILGGLEEGAPRPEPPVGAGAVETAPNDVAPRVAWLDGFAHRVAFHVQSDESIRLTGYSIALAFDTRAAVAARKMRESGADIRVTGSDALTPAPYWLATVANAPATTLWAKVDLAPGPNAIYVYYGNDAAESQSSLRDTFLDGIIANPTFDGTTPWVASPPSNGEPGLLEMSDQRASVSLSRARGTLPSSLGWCQSLTFPSGAQYRVVFDVTAVQADKAALAIWTGSVGGAVAWTDAPGAGRQRAAETGPIDAGPTRLCLGGTALADPRQQNLAVSFQNLRVRLFAESNPIAGPAEPEESR